MLTEKQLNRYADVLIWGLQTAKSRRIARNDIVLVRFDLAAVRLAEIIFAKLLEAGAHPLMRFNPTAAMERDYYSAYSGDSGHRFRAKPAGCSG